MAERFPIVEARQELGFTPTTAVRARIDTRTGEEAIGAAIVDLGVKWDLVAAKTQLSRSNIDASNRINEYFMELEGNDDPATYGDLFNKLSADLETLAPRNRKALRVYNENRARQIVQLGKQTRDAAKGKLQSNAQEVDFLLLQKAKDSGNENDFLKYRTSVIGNLKLGDVYTATEAERLLDNARSEAELVKTRAKIATEEALIIQQEADRDMLGKRLAGVEGFPPLDYSAIDNSSLSEKEQQVWYMRMLTDEDRKTQGLMAELRGEVNFVKEGDPVILARTEAAIDLNPMSVTEDFLYTHSTQGIGTTNVTRLVDRLRKAKEKEYTQVDKYDTQLATLLNAGYFGKKDKQATSATYLELKRKMSEYVKTQKPTEQVADAFFNGLITKGFAVRGPRWAGGGWDENGFNHTYTDAQGNEITQRFRYGDIRKRKVGNTVIEEFYAGTDDKGLPRWIPRR